VRDNVSPTAKLMSIVQRPASITVQLALVVLSNWFAFQLRFDWDMPAFAREAFWAALPWLVAIRASTFIGFRLQDGMWRYASIYDVRAIVTAVAASSLVFYLATFMPFGPPIYPLSLFIVDATALTLLLSGVRLARRLATESNARDGKRVLIVGAGDAGELIVRDMKNSRQSRYRVVGFADDDPRKVGHRIHGVPVLGTCAELPSLLTRHRPQEVLLAIPNAEPAAVRAIVRTLEPFKIPIKTLPNLRDLIDGKLEVSQIRSLSVEDLLTRAPIGLTRDPLKHLIGGRRVMVTGAGGSIGSELCRQIARLKPASLVMLERYENSLHAIRLELEDARKQQFGLYPVIGDVTDAGRLADVMRETQPEIVFHAAAHKHVPLMEENPCEAIKNNVRGTRLMAQAAEEHGVDRFILISTDKAVNPTSVMGASKRLAELIVQMQAAGSSTSFCIVRFGNVLGSNGSVVPRFLEQIRKGGPVTITHPEIRRFFMLIPEAVQLVLHAAAQAEGGSTYVLEMGDQVKLVDMARHLIRLSGYVPDDEIPLEFVGLRPGEKLFEELVGQGEEVGPSAVEKILRVTSRVAPRDDLNQAIAQLEYEAALGRQDAVFMMLRELTALSSTAEPEVAPSIVAEPASRSVDLPDSVEQPCPSCGESTLFRSKARSLPERLRRSWSIQRLFRCSTCGWRGWLLPIHVSTSEAVELPTVPDFAALDVALQASPPEQRRSFSPHDLQ